MLAFFVDRTEFHEEGEKNMQEKSRQYFYPEKFEWDPWASLVSHTGHIGFYHCRLAYEIVYAKTRRKKRRHHRRRRFIWYAFCVRFAYHSFHTPFMMSSARSFHLPSRFMDISLCFSSELINTAHMLTQNGP